MLLEFPERVARENIAIVEILTKNFPKWKKIIKPQIQESLQSPSQINTQKKVRGSDIIQRIIRSLHFLGNGKHTDLHMLMRQVYMFYFLELPPKEQQKHMMHL